jgi:hypothetical protein
MFADRFVTPLPPVGGPNNNATAIGLIPAGTTIYSASLDLLRDRTVHSGALATKVQSSIISRIFLAHSKYHRKTGSIQRRSVTAPS